MTDPLSLLKKQKGDEPKAKQAPKASAAPSLSGSGIGGLFDVESSLGAPSRSAGGSSLFDVESSLGSPGSGSATLTAGQRVQQALAASSNVDFPMVTEICEAVAKEPSNTPEVVRLLCNAFGEARGPPRRKLKALTIMHELIYDQRAAAEVKKVPGARDALWDLQKLSGSGLGSSADEQIRMFATEIEKSCYGASGDPFAPLSSADPFAPTFTSSAPTPAPPEERPAASGYPDSGGFEPRQRKRDQAMDGLWQLGSMIKDNLASAGAVAQKSMEQATETAKGQLGLQSSLPRPDIPKLPVDPRADRPSLNIQFEGMLAGEKVHHSVKQAYLLTSNPFCETPGRLLLTNFRMKFQVQKGTLREELSWLHEKQALDIPLGIVEEVRLENPISEAGVAQWRLRLIAKDCRSLVVLVSDPQDLSIAEEHVSALAQPGEHFTSVLFAFQHAKETWAQGGDRNTDGWDIYDPSTEYARMGIDTSATPSGSSPYWLNPINRDYGICSSYPAWLVTPQRASESTVRGVASFRKRNRLPVMSWCGGSTLGFASLWRCSQPTEGILGNSSGQDEQYVQAIRSGVGSGRDRELLTLDLRSKKAAIANKVGGGGFEQYSGCRVVFGGIGNVHDVRDAWRKMQRAVSSLSSSEVGSWFKDVANSGWYDIVGAVMYCVAMVIEELDERKCNALIHCSDGWDRTAQVSSLVMLCVDPHYRSLRGLLILIQKEFCSFGHRFRTRLANGEKPTSEFSPIFIQWLECVYQLTTQFPEAFEFTPALLLFIGKEGLTNRYGTFLTDSEKERTEVGRNTLSLWSAILNAGPTGPAREHVNSDYRRVAGILRPSPSQINFNIWEEYWFRYQVHPRDERR